MRTCRLGGVGCSSASDVSPDGSTRVASVGRGSDDLNRSFAGRATVPCAVLGTSCLCLGGRTIQDPKRHACLSFT